MSEQPADRGRILVVEDELHIRLLLEQALRGAADANYDVRTAADGLSALEEVRRDPPDLILLDVAMPRMDGYEVCRRLKANPLTSRIPVIFLTARSSLEERLEGLNAFGDDYVTKPFANEEVLFRVRNQLRSRRALLSSNALTGLPGNVLIENELTRRIGAGEKFAFLHIDLDNFKAFNDYYGYARGDALIQFTAELLGRAVEKVGGGGDFVGHIGGDDFVIMTVPDRAGLVADCVKREFDSNIASQYDPEDAERGFITVLSNRQGGVKNFGLLSVTIPVVTNVGRDIQHSAQVNDIVRELKKLGKAIHGSCIVPDRRSDGTLVGPARESHRTEPRA